jgi:hypothetical protein
MEFTKDIYFDNNLTNGKTATITYAGELFRNGSEHVNLVSGFGENWDYTTTTPMTKTDNGFVANMQIKDYDTFNFCFSNENNVWDNNNYFNYVSPILPEVQEIVENNEKVNLELEFDSLEEFMNSIPTQNTESKQEIEFGADYSSSIDDIIEDILGNTVQNSIINSNESIDDILDTISKESIPEIEAIFNELFFEEDNDEQVVPEQNIVTTDEKDNSELVELFNELFADIDKPVLSEEKVEENTNVLNVASFNLDGLVAELLEPVIASTIQSSEEDSLFNNTNKATITEETALIAVDNGLQVSSRRLGTFYKLKKRISLACYKLFVKAPKDLAKQLGFNLN